MEIIGGEGWQLVVPAKWAAVDEGEFVSIVKDEDGGAITISALIDEEEDISKDELEIYARSKLPRGTQLKKLKIEKFDGFHAEYQDEDGNYWLHCWLAHLDLMIYFNYNGDQEAWKNQKKEVKEILNSLKVNDD